MFCLGLFLGLLMFCFFVWLFCFLVLVCFLGCVCFLPGFVVFLFVLFPMV